MFRIRISGYLKYFSNLHMYMSINILSRRDIWALDIEGLLDKSKLEPT